MTPQERVPYVQILAQILIADGVLNDAERSHLDEVMNALDMPAAERDAVFRGVSLDSPIEERVGLLSEDVQRSLLVEAERALEVDGQTSAAEAYLFERLRKLVG